MYKAANLALPLASDLRTVRVNICEDFYSPNAWIEDFSVQFLKNITKRKAISELNHKAPIDCLEDNRKWQETLKVIIGGENMKDALLSLKKCFKGYLHYPFYASRVVLSIALPPPPSFAVSLRNWLIDMTTGQHFEHNQITSKMIRSVTELFLKYIKYKKGVHVAYARTNCR